MTKSLTRRITPTAIWPSPSSSPYRDALANDGYLTFGMIFQHDGGDGGGLRRAREMPEDLVEPAGRHSRGVYQFGIPEVAELSFIDEFRA